jgi:hypothetical protein
MLALTLRFIFALPSFFSSVPQIGTRPTGSFIFSVHTHLTRGRVLLKKTSHQNCRLKEKQPPEGMWVVKIYSTSLCLCNMFFMLVYLLCGSDKLLNDFVADAANFAL